MNLKGPKACEQHLLLRTGDGWDSTFAAQVGTFQMPRMKSTGFVVFHSCGRFNGVFLYTGGMTGEGVSLR